MKIENLTIPVRVFQFEELEASIKSLFGKAIENLPNAHAPYSQFHVASASLLENGAIVCGTNQENASFPLGLCAERVNLAAIASLYPKTKILKMAIVIENKRSPVLQPVAPCGMCRQAILEQENIANSPIEIWLKGQGDIVYAINTVKDLLPINFDGTCLV